MYILIDWVWGNSKFVVPETLNIDLGFASVNSQGRGDNRLAIPEYPVDKYFIIPKNIRLIVEWSPQNDKRPIKSHIFCQYFALQIWILSHGHFYAISTVIHNDSFEKVDFNINLHSDYKSYENFEFFWNFWNFKILWKFWNYEL
jgi:hypothetical protein